MSDRSPGFSLLRCLCCWPQAGPEPDERDRLLADPSCNHGSTIYGSRQQDRVRDRQHNHTVVHKSQKHWFTGLDREAKALLLDQLLKLDDMYRVRPTDATMKAIQGGAEWIVEHIKSSLYRRDKRFLCTIKPGGSTANHTKITCPDEFDFGFILSSNHLFGITCKTVADWKKVQTQVFTQTDAATLTVWQQIRRQFETLLHSILEKMEGHLPAGWQHSGYNSPQYSGVRYNGPAYMLQFTYTGPHQTDPLPLTIDLTLFLQIPFSIAQQNPSLDWKSKSSDSVFVALQRRLMSDDVMLLLSGKGAIMTVSDLEDQWLKRSHPNSVIKSVIRICKILSSLNTCVMASMIDPGNSFESLCMNMRQQCETVSRRRADRRMGTGRVGAREAPVSMSAKNIRIFDLLQSEGATLRFDQTGEHVGLLSCFTSYLYKKLVVAMNLADQRNNIAWQKQHIPHLVVSVFEIIHDQLKTNHGPSSCIHYRGRHYSSFTSELLITPYFDHLMQHQQLAHIVLQLQTYAGVHSDKPLFFQRSTSITCSAHSGSAFCCRYCCHTTEEQEQVDPASPWNYSRTSQNASVPTVGSVET